MVQWYIFLAWISDDPGSCRQRVNTLKIGLQFFAQNQGQGKLS